MSDEVAMNDEQTEAKADSGPNGRVVPSHSTGVDMTSAWDRTVEYRKMRSPSTPAYYNRIFAYQTPNNDGTRKTHYSFIHHFVGEGGQPGEASMRALSSAIAVLNGGRSGTILRGAARDGVYRHLANHYAAADREAPELKSDEDVDAIMMYKGLIDAPLAATATIDDVSHVEIDTVVQYEIEGKIMAGVVLDINDDDDTVEVQEIDLESGELIEAKSVIEYSDIKLRTFTVMEKSEYDIEPGVVVSWDTSAGRFYGDVVEVVTDGEARGEPQGLVLEGTADEPVFVIRVWMLSGDEMGEDEPAAEEEPAEDEAAPEESASMYRKNGGEWHPTNVTIVARGAGLRVEDALPQQAPDAGYDEETTPEETPMKNINADLQAKIDELLKAANEIASALAEVKTEVEVAETVTEEPAVEQAEVKAEEVEAPVAEVTEEKAAEEVAVAETQEVAAEVTEEKAAEQTEVAETTEAAPAIETPALSFDDLKAFHDLIKSVSK